MEMRWEKLYSSGLGEFHQSDRPICRPVRRSSRLNRLWVSAMVAMLAIGGALVFI